ASQLSKALYELQQQQEQQAIQQEQQCFQLWQNKQQQFTQIRTELTQLQSAMQQANDKFKLQHQELVTHIAQFDIQLDLTQPHAEITTVQQQYISETTQFKQQIEIELQQLHQANKNHYHLTQTIQNIRYQLESIQQLQQQIQHVVDCLTTDEQNLWQQQTLSYAQQLAQRLQQRSEQLEHAETLNKQQQQLEQQLNLLKSNLTSLLTQHAEFNQQLKGTELKGKQNTESAHQLIVAMTGLTELKANEWLNQHDQQRQQLQNQYQQIKQRFEQARQNFEQQKNELEQLKAQQQQQQTTVTQTKTEIRAWLSQHPEFEEHQLADLLSIRAEQEQQIRTSLQNAERLLNEATSALKTLQQQLQTHQQQQPPLEHTQLIEYIHLNHEKLQQQAEQRDQFKLKLEVHQQNLAKQKQFADQIQQIQQQEHRWNKISSLIGDSKGKDFRDLAQQYNLDILLEYANQQLSMLSQRYTLKRLDNSLSLAIIDHDMDGETRSVASLSGGESFLTALAISLAIANMASGSMKIESLFIDEGFGTLDASSLHMVMNALDQLQSQGRKVILISHIQEMHERIPVQIQVQPLGSGSSRIEVVG
ncbi:MAG: SbcC/MukB-like Walker B domain-containing protein, partial [Acinetobacter sp.]